MKKYFSFFRVRFVNELQYRSAALAGISTQFFWGMMEVLLYKAFLEADPTAFPMDFSALANYIWLQQAFLAVFAPWRWEQGLYNAVIDGSIAYDLCRPAGIYEMWFVRATAGRCAAAALRCGPILLIAVFVPKPYGLTLPPDPAAFFWFVVTMLLALGAVVALTMVVYMSAFFTSSPQGVRMIFVSLADLCTGAVIPLPFLPDGLRRLFEIQPFASVQNVPLRVYSGNLCGAAMLRAVCLQVFWVIVLIWLGKRLEQRGLKKVVLAGG